MNPAITMFVIPNGHAELTAITGRTDSSHQVMTTISLGWPGSLPPSTTPVRGSTVVALFDTRHPHYGHTTTITHFM